MRMSCYLFLLLVSLCCVYNVFGCAWGRYGKNCTGTCRCRDARRCDNMTGSCEKANGCKDGWFNEPGRHDCQKGCKAGTFGKTCSGACHCKNQEKCAKSTGSCFIAGGCAENWRSSKYSYTCQLHFPKCSTGKYGENCAFTCHCKNDKCDKVTGKCKDGCSAGWKNSGMFNYNCQIQCKPGDFGENCRKKCHCKDASKCDAATGSCSAAGGCADGWLNNPGSENCQKGCGGNRYGKNCAKMCRCKKWGACNKASGSCLSAGGCGLGWMSDVGLSDCRKRCPPGKFGYGCRSTCNCVGTCRVDYGRCQRGCAPGFVGLGCQTACSDGYFGKKCASQCNCFKEKEICNKVSGACVSGCAEGLRWPSCQSRCSAETFGYNCSRTCHCRSDSEICLRSSGRCYSGCAEGWTGSHCQQIIYKPIKLVHNDDNDVLAISPLLVGLGIGVALLAVLCIILIVTLLCFMRHQQARREKPVAL